MEIFEMKLKTLLVGAVSAAGLMLASTAQASTHFLDVIWTSPAFNANLLIEVEDAFDPVTFASNVVDGWGTIDGQSVVLVDNPTPGAVSTSPFGMFYFDNLITPVPNFFSNAGLLFKNGAGTTEFNLFTVDPGDIGSAVTVWSATAGGYVRHDILGSLEVLPHQGSVPEPGAWALMILGFGVAGSMLRSRRFAAA